MQVQFQVFSTIHAEKNPIWRRLLRSVISHVVLLAYPIMLNISTRNGVTKILQRKLYCEFKWSLQRNQENVGHISCHRHFNDYIRELREFNND